jgi:hypothetical protein
MKGQSKKIKRDEKNKSSVNIATKVKLQITYYSGKKKSKYSQRQVTLEIFYTITAY